MTLGGDSSFPNERFGMSLPRREFLGLVSVSALSMQVSRRSDAAETGRADLPLIASPPVVQHPTADSFTVHFAVSALATGWVEWGWSPERIDQVAIAAEHGLVRASDQALSVRVRLDKSVLDGRPIFYRVVAQSLIYKNAYQLERGDAVSSRVYRLRLPEAKADRTTIAIVNDTHENKETLASLHARVAAIEPDLLIWNGDTCNDFDTHDDPIRIALNPADDVARGWAAERPLLFVPGNHDVRGERARQLAAALSGWPGQSDLPYNFAVRVGPVALVGLDTGEDKPDAHPVFAGMAAYEPYRQEQAHWLAATVKRPEIATAPIRIAICHIPLRGLPGQNDGTTLQGHAAYSGMGAKLWLPILRQARFAAVISGHMHKHRIDDADEKESIVQVVGGGPQPKTATLTTIRAAAGKAIVEVEDLSGKTIGHREWNLSVG